MSKFNHFAEILHRQFCHQHHWDTHRL
uniref:Uncharacterized protein n=1 Tax=Anguilla anguilla TaxID=7936 RepID=A0A0E9XST8_ANGAN